MKAFVELSEVAEVTDGTHYTPPNSGGPFPFVTVADMQNGSLALRTCSRISSEEFTKAKAAGCCPVRGDVLFSKDGTVGKVHIVDAEPEFAVLSSVAILRPNSSKIKSEYLSFALRNDRILADAQNRKTGSALQRIILADLKRVKIPLPSPETQRRIASELEKADRLRRTRRYAFNLCDEFLPAAFLEMFCAARNDWPIVTIEDLAARSPNAIRTGPFGSQLLHSEFTTTGIAVLGIDNAVNNRFEWAERRYISPEKYSQLKRYMVSPGDVIITIMGTCGRCAIIPKDIPLAINTKHLCCITPDVTVALPSFIHAAFLHHPLIKHQLGASQKGAIMDGLNMEIIKSLRIPLPPVDLQNQFDELSARHAATRSTHVEALRQADHLFQTLLHQAFN